MSPGDEGKEWHWLWEAYVAGICVAAFVAVVLLNDRFPGNVPVAAAALGGILVWVLAVGRPVARLPELDWPRIAFVGVVVGLWVIAILASPVAIAAVPAMYPLVFMSLPLRTALVVTTAITVTPLALLLLGHGTQSPNFGMAVSITLVGLVTAPVIGTVTMTSIRQRQKLTELIAALAESRAESARLSREAGAAAERERLARDIHDTLAQGFTSIVALAQAVEPELETDTAAAKRHVELIRITARENLAEARVMVAELSPAALRDGSLPAAIQRQCDRLSAETGVVVTMRSDADLPPLGMATNVVLLRAAQEAFANIRKHAKAEAVMVELTAQQRNVRLLVADNGVGLQNTHVDGFGLRGMRARVAQVGGTMAVAPTPGGGTTVRVEVPA